MFDADLIVIGAGVVGLAVAREAALAGLDVLVLERHGLIGSETSARSSEVIHAGIYYPKNSVKARLCVEGKHRLYEFCDSHHVAHRRIGKLIVAACKEQLTELDDIGQRARDNGVDDLTFIDAAGLKVLEPALHGAGALHSTYTGIIDSHAFLLALQGSAEDRGASIAFNAEVTRLDPLDGGGLSLCVRAGDKMTISARQVVVCAGLHTPHLLAASGLSDVLPMPSRYAKGNYFRLAAKAPFSRLIYPVPERGGLGIHLTLDMAGQARFGPDVEWTKDVGYAVDPDRVKKFYAAIRTYWPALKDGTLFPDYAGIRPKLVGPEEPNADFLVASADHLGVPGLVSLLGIESPGLTASLAIADRVMKLLR